MQHFIGLQIQRPIARAAGQSLIRFMGEEQAVFLHRIIPHGFHDANLVRSDRADQIQRPVVRPADVDHEFVHDRQRRSNGLHDGVIELHRVPANGKAADFHK